MRWITQDSEGNKMNNSRLWMQWDEQLKVVMQYDEHLRVVMMQWDKQLKFVSFGL